MNSKSVFIRYLIFTCGLVLVSIFLLPRHYNISYPAPLGPTFNPDLKKEYIRDIEVNQPDIVLIGDSVLYEGVDPDQLSNELGVKSYSMARVGAGTASWYLTIKNIILASQYRPKYVVIFFRNTMLTVPQYRTTGRYFELLDDFAEKNEPLVSKLAFIDQMSPIEQFAQKYIPVYSARLEIRQDLDHLIRYTPTSILAGCDRACTDDAVSSIFGREVDPIALDQLMEDAASTLYAPQEMNFDKQVNDSFLPYMIQLAQKNNINLIFVRTKVNGNEPLALERYAKSLNAYLKDQKNVYLVDFTHDPRILPEYFVDSLHMNAHGKQVFTTFLADEFKKIIKK